MILLTVRSLCSLSAISIILLICSYGGVNAQTDCPTVSQINQNGITDWGVEQTTNVPATVQVQVVDTTQGDFSEEQVQAFETAIESIAAIPGSNVDAATGSGDLAAE